MWLRTSASSSNDFDLFLCYGEGVFADCLDWIPSHERWPAGDAAPQDGDDEEEDLDQGQEEVDYLRDLALSWDRPANSAPLM